MRTYSEFTESYLGKTFWYCDAGQDDEGNDLLDVLAYETEDDRDADDDNSLAIARETVVDNRRET